MMAFATTNPATLRRWAISAVVVVLVHGAIVTAVETWRKATVPAEPPGPVVIELAPMPAAPTTEHAALPPAPEQVPPTASPDKTLEKVEQKAEEKTAARGEEKAEPSQFEDSPRVTAPVTLAPPESAEGGIERTRKQCRAVRSAEPCRPEAAASIQLIPALASNPVCASRRPRKRTIGRRPLWAVYRRILPGGNSRSVQARQVIWRGTPLGCSCKLPRVPWVPRLPRLPRARPPRMRRRTPSV